MNPSLAKKNTVEHVGLKFARHLPLLKADPLAFFSRCQQDHGDLVYAKLPFLKLFMINDPAHAKALLQTHHKHLNRPTLLKNVSKRYGFEGVLSDDGEPWRKARKKLTTRLTTANLNAQWEDLRTLIQTRIHEGITFESQPVLSFFSSISLETVFRFLYESPKRNSALSSSMTSMCFWISPSSIYTRRSRFRFGVPRREI